MGEEEEKRWEREEEAEGGVGVGGQDNELFAHTINLIMKKLKAINRRVIDQLISPRSVSFLVLTLGGWWCSKQQDRNISVKYPEIYSNKLKQLFPHGFNKFSQ